MATSRGRKPPNVTSQSHARGGQRGERGERGERGAGRGGAGVAIDTAQKHLFGGFCVRMRRVDRDVGA
jgi:hypothetical protein